jgi:hypothetical protein
VAQDSAAERGRKRITKRRCAGLIAISVRASLSNREYIEAKYVVAGYSHLTESRKSGGNSSAVQKDGTLRGVGELLASPEGMIIRCDVALPHWCSLPALPDSWRIGKLAVETTTWGNPFGIKSIF